MALLPIYETPDPMLRQISTPVDKVDDELRARAGASLMDVADARKNKR